jgi:hypothetical protein
MHNENQLLEKMPKLKSKKFNKRFFNLKYGIQKIFNRQQLNEKTESIVTPRIQEVNDGAGSSREILNENLYVLFKLAFTAQRDNLLQKNLFDSKLSEFLISCIFVIKMHCFCQKNLKINMFFMFDYVKINRSDFC